MQDVLPDQKEKDPSLPYGKNYHYQVLGIDPNADIETINEAFEGLVAPYNEYYEEPEVIPEYMALVDAYDTLTILRDDYDYLSSQAEKFPEYKQLAEQKDAEAQYMLGRFYELGVGTARNLENASKYYQLSAAQGNPIGQYLLGRYYFLFGDEIPKNRALAFKMCLGSALQGYPQAQYYLAMFFEQGIGVPQDLSHAIQWYLISEKQGVTEANIKLQNIQSSLVRVESETQHKSDSTLAEPEDEKATFLLYRSSAGIGNSTADYQLGNAYEYGKGVQRNFSEAIKWYKSAKNKGNPEAYLRLQNILSSLNSADAHTQYKAAAAFIEQGDEKTAFLLYQSSADQGHAAAEYQLGICYQFGAGVTINQEQAFRCYKKSAAGNHVNAYYKLGDCYREGIGVAEDSKEALRHYKLAAERGSAIANYQLGICYEKGIGTPKNEKEAFEHYEISAELGYARARYQVGICYEGGIGVIEDKKEALRNYQLSAEQGNAEANYRLGLHFETEKDKDIEKAFRFYRIAEGFGSLPARSKVESFRSARKLQNRSRFFGLEPNVISTGSTASMPTTDISQPTQTSHDHKGSTSSEISTRVDSPLPSSTSTSMDRISSLTPTSLISGLQKLHLHAVPQPSNLGDSQYHQNSMEETDDYGIRKSSPIS